MVIRQEIDGLALRAASLAASLASLADRVGRVEGDLLLADVFEQLTLSNQDCYALGHGPSGVIVVVPRQESAHKTKSTAIAALRAAVAVVGKEG